MEKIFYTAKNAFPSSEAALRHVLSTYFKIENAIIEKNEHGKPYLENADDIPLHFSISHTKNHAFCAIAPVNLGIDAEEMDRPIKLSLAEKILSSGELFRFRQAKDPRAALLRLWVLKEAAAKRGGEGLRGYPSHTDFSPEDPRIYEIGGCYVAVLTEGE